MSQQLVSDEFWGIVEPLLPVVVRRRRYPGRKRVDDRACLEAIMYVLKTGCQWAMVPAELTGCSGKTAWRRMDQWDRAGVWDRLHDRPATSPVSRRPFGKSGSLCYLERSVVMTEGPKK